MITWILANWNNILAAYGIIVAAGTAIVKITPSNKDDTVWGYFVKFCDFFSTAYTDSDKNLLKKGLEKVAEEAKKTSK